MSNVEPSYWGAPLPTFDLRPSSFDLARRGFTLTELLVVMLVLSILAGLTVAALAGAVNNARASAPKRSSTRSTC